MKARPGYRTPVSRLAELSSEYMFLHLEKPRRDVLGHLPLGDIGLQINRYMAERFGAQREEGLQVCADEAARLLDQRAWRKLPREERLVWERWAPLAMLLPGVSRWSASQRRALRDVIRAKGGRREQEYVLRFDAHQPLRRAILRLGRDAPR